MTALISFLTIVTLTMLVTRIATVALVRMGLSREVALFQVTSALSGTGFTTSEAELVVNRPMRRRLLIWLMRIGQAGVITLVSSLMLTFVSTQSVRDQMLRVGILAAGLALLWLLAVNKTLDHWLSRWISSLLSRYTDLPAHDYEALLGITAGYRVAEIDVETNSWLADKTLAEANIMAEGALVLGIYRPNGHYLGSPHGQTRINSGDKLIIYATNDVLHDLHDRIKGVVGNQAHRASIKRHQQLEREEDAADALYSSEPLQQMT